MKKSSLAMIVLSIALGVSQANAGGAKNVTKSPVVTNSAAAAAKAAASTPATVLVSSVASPKDPIVPFLLGTGHPAFVAGVNEIVSDYTNYPAYLRARKLNELLEVNDFIRLPETFRKEASISHVGISQEVWVHVLKHNPSEMKEKKYCPDTHREVTFTENLDGKGPVERKVQMCPKLPVDNVSAAMSQAKKDSRDSMVEFYAAANGIYQAAGILAELSDASAEEWEWADSEGGKKKRSQADEDFAKYVTYWEISDKDPLDLEKASPSEEHQPHSVKGKLPNALGFYRSGVWEWTSSTSGSFRFLVGGSFDDLAGNAAFGYRLQYQPGYRDRSFGASRVVRTILGSTRPF